MANSVDPDQMLDSVASDLTVCKAYLSNYLGLLWYSIIKFSRHKINNISLIIFFLSKINASHSSKETYLWNAKPIFKEKQEKQSNGIMDGFFK